MDKLALLKRRLSAASSQILDFGCGAEKFEQANTLQAKCEVKIEGEKKVITYRFISVPPDEDLHILASSCVHHLRSVCDNIVVALGEKYSLNNWEQLAFPNFLKSSDFDKWKAKNSGFSSDLLDAFASLQPTEVVDSPFGSLSNSIHPMQLLSILNNHDKHRMLIVCGVQPTSMLAIVKNGLKSGMHFSAGFGNRLLNDGDELAVLKMPMQYSDDDFHGIKISPKLVVDDQDIPLYVREAYPLLAYLRHFVEEDVVNMLSPFFS